MEMYDLLLAKALGGGGGGGVTVEELNVTQNGDYSEEGKAYSPVHVNVSGGGGGLDLLGTFQLGTLYNASGTQDVGTYTLKGFNPYDVLLSVIELNGAGTKADQFIASVQYSVFARYGEQVTISKASTFSVFRKYTQTIARTQAASSGYGVYISSFGTISAGDPGDNGSMPITVKSTYGSSYGIVDGTYIMKVYGMKLYDFDNYTVLL